MRCIYTHYTALKSTSQNNLWIMSLLSSMGGFNVKQNWEKILYLFSLTDPNYRLSWRLFRVSHILKRRRKMLSREESMHRIQSQCILLSTVALSMAIHQFFLADVNFTILQAFISLTSSQYMHIFGYSFFLGDGKIYPVVIFKISCYKGFHAAWKRRTPEKRRVNVCHWSCYCFLNTELGGWWFE